MPTIGSGASAESIHAENVAYRHARLLSADELLVLAHPGDETVDAVRVTLASMPVAVVAGTFDAPIAGPWIVQGSQPDALLLGSMSKGGFFLHLSQGSTIEDTGDWYTRHLGWDSRAVRLFEEDGALTVARSLANDSFFRRPDILSTEEEDGIQYLVMNVAERSLLRREVILPAVSPLFGPEERYALFLESRGGWNDSRMHLLDMHTLEAVHSAERPMAASSVDCAVSADRERVSFAAFERQGRGEWDYSLYVVSVDAGPDQTPTPVIARISSNDLLEAAGIPRRGLNNWHLQLVGGRIVYIVQSDRRGHALLLFDYHGGKDFSFVRGYRFDDVGAHWLLNNISALSDANLFSLVSSSGHIIQMHTGKSGEDPRFESYRLERADGAYIVREWPDLVEPIGTKKWGQ